MLKKTSAPCGFFEETDAALSQRFSEAGFGRELGGRLFLSTLEALYLAKTGKAKFESSTPESVLASEKKGDRGFPFAFAVYLSIRKSGRVMLPAGDSREYFRVFSPGVGRLDSRPVQLLRLCPGKKLPGSLVEKEVAFAHLERLDLIVATGSEKEIRFYKVSSFNF